MPNLEEVKQAMSVIEEYCNNNKTCAKDKCVFVQNHIGCPFRGKSPKEWALINTNK